MKKKTTKPSHSGSTNKTNSAANAVRHASRRKKPNEVASAGTLRSSLNSDVDVTVAPPDDSPAFTAGQSGDLQGLSNVAEADPESVDELLEDGQAFEAEAVSGVENAREEKEVPSRGRLEDSPIPAHEYKDRNKI